MLVLASLILTGALVSASQTPDVPPREREILMELVAATDSQRCEAYRVRRRPDSLNQATLAWA